MGQIFHEEINNKNQLTHNEKSILNNRGHHQFLIQIESLIYLSLIHSFNKVTKLVK